MKRQIFFLMIALVVGTLSSSAKKADGDTIAIDNIMYRVQYATRHISDTTRTPAKVRTGENRLDIGDKASRFYSRSKELQDSVLYLQAAAVMAGKSNVIDMRNTPSGNGLTWEYYKDYPAAGQSTYLERAASTDFQCVEAVETPEWTLIPDSTATILDYACQLAVTQFKGRTWYAWYAEDLPIDNGPWKLHGLPGLILKAYDAQGHYSFTAIGLQNINGALPLKFVKKDRETVSQKDLRKVKESDDPSRLLTGTKAWDAQGKALDSKTIHKSRPFNGIER